MTKNAQGVSLKKSKRFTELNGVKIPNLPSADKLVEGELAINYAEGVETISTKNESGTVVTFSSDDYYTSKKLGSGFTGVNSAKTVTEAIEEIQPNVNADWDETDETSPSFIENKPFGDECESVIGFESTFTAVQVGSNDYGLDRFNFTGDAAWVEGDTYRVTINDDVYVRTCVRWVGGLGLNVDSGALSPYTDTWSINNFGTSCMFASKQIALGDTVHLKVEQLVCTIKKLDEKYIDTAWEKGEGDNSVKLINNEGTASASFSVSEGFGASATSIASHAEGNGTTANGVFSHAEGDNTIASGQTSHAEGYNTKASGQFSHTEGNSTTANGNSSHAEGNSSIASGSSSHAEGQSTSATSFASHTEGLTTLASGSNGAHAEGFGASATSMASHAEGQNTLASGSYSHAEGSGTKASGEYSHAENYQTSATSMYSHAEGESTIASGRSSHAEGSSTNASGDYGAHAEGSGTKASGQSSHAEGYVTIASGGYGSHAEGSGTTASGQSSHSEGESTSATSRASHAEGVRTSASGNYGSHAEGDNTLASGQSSHAEGAGTSATSDYAHTEGYHTIAKNNSEHASGKFNVSSSASTTFGGSGNTLFSVGNGTANDARHNAFEIRQNGDIYIVGKNGQDVKLQDEIGNITVDQVIDETTSASTNAVSTSAVFGFVTASTPTVDQVIDSGTSASTNAVATKAVYDVITDNEMVWANTFAVLSGAVSSHTEDTDVHVTTSDKTNWNGKLDATAYTPTDLSNYYTKAQTSGATELSTAFDGKADTATTLAGYGITNAYTKSEIDTMIGDIETLLAAI